MQGKIFAIPYAAWIAAFVFDVLIIIDSYPAALLLFLLLSYHSYKKFFLKQAGTYKILICLGGEIFLSLLCILTISLSLIHICIRQLFYFADKLIVFQRCSVFFS